MKALDNQLGRQACPGVARHRHGMSCLSEKHGVFSNDIERKLCALLQISRRFLKTNTDVVFI